MILFIDNYDSFTFNLVDYLGQLESNLVVVRNDKISIASIRNLKPEGMVLSPGPGTPDSAGICNDVIRQLGAEVPILGVCLGHQCIGSVFGATVVRAPLPVHGKVSDIFHKGHDLFTDIPSPFQATRYHSLIIDRTSLPDELNVIAETEDGIIMAIQHKSLPLIGVQFHPESILTNCGFTILKNWLQYFVYQKVLNSH